MQTIDHKRGDTFDGIILNLSYEMIEGVEQDPPVPVDLTDAQVRVKFRLGSMRASVNYDFSTATDDVVISDAENGQVEILKEKIIDWPHGKWYFDVQVTFPDERVLTVLTAILNIVEDITR